MPLDTAVMSWADDIGSAIPSSIARQWIKPGTYSPPKEFKEFPCFHYKVPLPLEVMKITIGKAGHHFKQITEECDIAYMWHDRDKGHVEFWGEKEKVRRAMWFLKHRIDHVLMHGW